jgi:pyruvate dehydrogenase E1 component alpha subunit
MKEYHFFPSSPEAVASQLGSDTLRESLFKMLLIRHFEIRGEAAYQQGKVGGFYHAYIGQEAIQVGCLAASGQNHWFTTTYRCHALALLLGATPNEMMAELYGRATGLAKGLGGSMHMYADNLLGGLAIVGGHVPIATGAAFTIKYKKEKGKASFCFLGDGAVVQGAVHESLNLASLWNLPCLFVIENNQWGMGTAVARAVCVQPIAESMASAYAVRSYTLDGQDFFNCFAGFQDALSYVLKESKPVLIEVITERLRGHSISDPAVYRTKESLAKIAAEKDPILLMKKTMLQKKWLTEEEFEKMDQEAKETVLAAMKFAEESPWPDPITLEEGVFAPEEN